MKNNLKKTIKLFYNSFLALVFSAAFSHSAKSQTVNFSGTWKVDSLKSNFGGFVSPVRLKIVQTIDTLSIESAFHTGRGDARSFTDKLPLDGKPMTNTKGTTKSSVSVKWSGQALVETASYLDVASNSTYQATETWTLSPDRKTLTIARVIANDGEGGHGVSNAIYHRE
ncbi:MAG TPA: hypothetical protein VK787_07105 [Puia sp.]|jgi:hypothetical protein|nr:hypothetical protein [Puia sp.]